ncbi:MAG: glycosyltransferase [Planctomycetota bacterium]|nr:glycosyltransferase [Planctomycetota bacterium]
MKISGVIPVYQEEGCLAASVQEVGEMLEGLAPGEWELVLVNDGSADGTGRLIDQLAADDGRIRGAHHVENQGKGAAIRTGVALTTGELVFFSDADLSTPVNTLQVFMSKMSSDVDIVVGNRKSREATIELEQPWIRVQLGLGFTWLANLVTGLSIDDYTCGFKIFRGDAARKIFGELDTARWCFDVEVLARAVRDGLTIVQTPVIWHHVEDTRVRVARDVLQSFVELIAIRRKLGRVPKADRK